MEKSLTIQTRSPFEVENSQISFLNIYSSIEAGTDYAKLDRNKWQINEILQQYLSNTNAILAVIKKMQNRISGVGEVSSKKSQQMLQVKAVPKAKFQELEQWVKSVNWKIDLSNFKKLGEQYKNVLYAAVRTKIEGGNWQNVVGVQMKMQKLQIELANGQTLIDSLGNNVGQYHITPKGQLVEGKDKITVRITDITFAKGKFIDIQKEHLAINKFQPHPKKYIGFKFQSFNAKLNDKSLNPILGATNVKSPNEIWEFLAVAGDGWIAINEQTPLSYEMKSIAMMCEKSITKKKQESDPKYLELFHKTETQSIYFTNLVEILYNDVVIQTCVINESNMKGSF